MLYACYISVGIGGTLVLLCSTPIAIALYFVSFNSVQLFFHSFRFWFVSFFEMKSLLLQGAFWALIPSISAAVVYADDARVLRANRPRHIGPEPFNQVRNGDHISSVNIRSAPQNIGSIDLAGTINPGLVLSM